MPQVKKSAKFIFSKKGRIFRVNSFEEVEAIIFAQKIEGRNYALTRTATGYPGITFLQTGEFERLKSEGVKEISLKKAIQMQEDFLLRKRRD